MDGQQNTDKPEGPDKIPSGGPANDTREAFQKEWLDMPLSGQSDSKAPGGSAKQGAWLDVGGGIRIPVDDVKLNDQERELLWDLAKTEPPEIAVKSATETANKQLESSEMFKRLPTEDKFVLEKMQTAILEGNTRDLQQAIHDLHGDPQRLKQCATAVQRNLHLAGAHVNLDVNSDGKLLVYSLPGNQAIEVGVAGKAVARSIQTGPDGSVRVHDSLNTPSTTADQVAKDISSGAVADIVAPAGLAPTFPDGGPEAVLGFAPLEPKPKDKI